MQKSSKIFLSLVVFFLFGFVAARSQSTDGSSKTAIVCGVSNHIKSTRDENQSTKPGITWYALNKAQQLARENNKKVLVMAEASWCSYCKRMKSEVFPQAAVQKTMNHYFYPVKIDIESSAAVIFNGKKTSQEQFSREMGVSGTPTFIFIDKNGSVIGAQPGYMPGNVYSKLLAYVGSGAYNKVSFKNYEQKQ